MIPLQPPAEITRRSLNENLRFVIPALWQEIRLLERDPSSSRYVVKDCAIRLEPLFAWSRLLGHLIGIGEWKRDGVELEPVKRGAYFLGQTLLDETMPFQDDPLIYTCEAIDSFWLHHGNAWDVLPDGVFDSACRAVIAEFKPWSEHYFADRKARIERQIAAKRETDRAALPPSRRLPHDPDPASIDILHQAAREEVARWQPRLPGTDGLGNPTIDSAVRLANQHVILACTAHWYLKPASSILASLRQACDYAVRGILHDPALHAWTYEMWQHIAIVARHQSLSEGLWMLRREDWDHARIRPVNWLISRIRLLDLLHRGGAEEDLRALLETCRLGLFVEHLPVELERELPLMRVWYHLLRALVLRDQTLFDQRFVERQRLLADDWRSGGGIAAVALLDLGGLALIRVARLRRLVLPSTDSEYLSRELLAE